MLVGVTIILLVGALPTDDYVDAYVVCNDLVDQTNELILRQNKALDRLDAALAKLGELLNHQIDQSINQKGGLQ